mgnify:CR=1 FL=1
MVRTQGNGALGDRALPEKLRKTRAYEVGGLSEHAAANEKRPYWHSEIDSVG